MNTDPVPTIAEARERFSNYLDGLPLRDIALAILDHFEANGDEPLSIADVHRAAGRDDFDGHVMATLSHLTTSRNAPLEMRYDFVDEAGETYLVGPEAMSRVYRTDEFDHPVTGAPVAEAAKHIYPMVLPRPGLLREVTKGMAP